MIKIIIINNTDIEIYWAFPLHASREGDDESQEEIHSYILYIFASPPMWKIVMNNSDEW